MNLQLDHFSEMKKHNPIPERVGEEELVLLFRFPPETQQPNLRARTCLFSLERSACVCVGPAAPHREKKFCLYGTRLSQRVAMDDLASYFVEERSKVR